MEELDKGKNEVTKDKIEIIKSLDIEKLNLEIRALKEPFFFKAGFWAFLGILLTAFISDYPNRLNHKISTMKNCIKVGTDATALILKNDKDSYEKGVKLIDAEVNVRRESVEELENIALNLHKESLKFPMDSTLTLRAATAAADYFGRLNHAQSMELKAKVALSEKLTKEREVILSSISKELEKCHARA